MLEIGEALSGQYMHSPKLHCVCGEGGREGGGACVRVVI